jgi:Flp pilus assembly protein TadG
MFQRLFRDFRANMCGASALEFAIVFPVFILIVTGTFEMAGALRLNNELSYAASQVSRMVMMSRLDAENLQVTLTTQTIDGQSYRFLVLSYPYQLQMPFFAGAAFTLSVTKGIPQDI